jgi:hypothetical protein
MQGSCLAGLRQAVCQIAVMCPIFPTLVSYLFANALIWASMNGHDEILNIVLDDLGSDRRLEYTVVGSTVNIASRLQALAPPGGIMMTSRTRALLTHVPLCEGPMKVKLKGFDRDTEVLTIFPASLLAGTSHRPR